MQPPVAGRHRQADPVGQLGESQLKGFGISGLNPKVFLLLLVLLPQFVVATASWAVAAQILVLGLVANCAIVYTGVGIGARRVLGAARPRPVGSAGSPARR